MDYRVCGSGPAVLFLHGLPTSGRLWDWVVPQLQASFTCVVVDLPGAGKSPPFADGSLDPARFAQEVEALRAGLGLAHWHIVGHDAGSAIAVHYAASYPDQLQRLVLCSPPIFPEHQIPWFFRPLRTRGLGELLAPFVVRVLMPRGLQMAIRRPDADASDIIRAFCEPFQKSGGPQQFLHILRWGDPALVLGRTASLLPEISAPTLILSGLHDGAVPVSFAVRAGRQIPSARVDLLDNGHLIPLECPDLLVSKLLEFLADSGVGSDD